MKTFTSATRLLITGTPLQNNLKELWSLLNFLLPSIFTNWGQFESWFDFSDLQDEGTTEDFLGDQMKQDLIKKIHLVLQPLLLRRIKADVEHMLPKKREYLLYAPMTEEQTDLYRVLSDKTADVRKYLEDKVVERLTGSTNTPIISRKSSPKESAAKKAALKAEDSDSEEDIPLAVRIKAEQPKAATPKNAFQAMMAKKAVSSSKSSLKRKSADELTSSTSKSAKSSRESTPGQSVTRGRGRPRNSLVELPSSPAMPTTNLTPSGTPTKGRGRPRKSLVGTAASPAKPGKSTTNSTPAGSLTRSRGRPRRQKVYAETEASEEDEMSDDEFEQKLANELAVPDEASDDDRDSEEIQRTKTLELASKLYLSHLAD